MKKLRIFIPIVLFVIGCYHTGFSQKKVSEVYHFYELDTYHLTIKKIKDLKTKHQSRADIQLILADCYWNIEDRERSAQLYQRVARQQGIPASFQDKYALAIKHQAQQEHFSEPKNILSTTVAAKETAPTAVVSTEIVPPPAKKQAQPIPTSIVEKSDPPINTSINNSPSRHIQETPPVVSSSSPSPSVQTQTVIPAGKYRIRVGASSDLKDFDLSKIESVGTVEVQKWADKVIVFAGYYESSERAQSLIDDYLKEDYKNAVVVTKRDGRYRSVR